MSHLAILLIHNTQQEVVRYFDSINVQYIILEEMLYIFSNKSAEFNTKSSKSTYGKLFVSKAKIYFILNKFLLSIIFRHSSYYHNCSVA